MVRHISNHSSKSTFETELCQSHHAIGKLILWELLGHCSKSQLCLKHFWSHKVTNVSETHTEAQF